jgi:transposase InsO family protein
LVENQLGRRIKALRTDGGGEFCSTEFHMFLRDNGIARQRAPRDTPQQNGVAVRGNRTILEMSRCLLLAAHVPDEFWSSAVLVSAYLRNRNSTRTLLSVTPFEAWTGQKPSLSNLRVSDFCPYVHVLAS